MTIPAHAELIHAFADGKTLQVKHPDSIHWFDFQYPDAPRFSEYAAGTEWRIKPEPKVTRYLAWLDRDKEVRIFPEDATKTYPMAGWKRIPALDKEVVEDE